MCLNMSCSDQRITPVNIIDIDNTGSTGGTGSTGITGGTGSTGTRVVLMEVIINSIMIYI